MFRIAILFLFTSSLVSVHGQTNANDSTKNYLNLDTCVTTNMGLGSSDSLMAVLEHKKCNCYFVKSYDNRILVNGTLTDCKENGKWVEFYPDGTPRMITSYKNGKRDGEFLSYNKNGSIAVQCFWKDGDYHGRYLRFDDNGNIVEDVTYKDEMGPKDTRTPYSEADRTIVYLQLSPLVVHAENEREGVYVWDNGKEVFLREFSAKEKKSGNYDSSLDNKALKKYYKNKEN